MSINVTLMSGRIDGDARLEKSANSGKSFIRFKLKSDRQLRESMETAVVNAVAFGALAERVAGANGRELLVSGRLKTETWEYEGQPRSKLVLMVDEAQVFAGDAPATTSASNANADQPPF